MSQEKQIAIEERFAKVFNDNSFKERLSSMISKDILMLKKS